ncbi:AraC family transcriptional regulator [Chloroflexia bacterium SDU3-3]|nr:AraC family transcriptional regulator [Chloroflexia bacterium SDU3-3]
MDVLTDVLNGLELKGWLSSRRELTPRWRVAFLASSDSVFHMLRFGAGYIFVEGEERAIEVGQGDVVFFPRGQAHTICDDPAAPLSYTVPLDHTIGQPYEIFPSAGGRTDQALLCGAFRFEHPGLFPLLHLLPNVIHIPGAHGHMQPAFAAIVNLIASESASPQPGRGAVLSRLAELLVIQMLRVWIEQQDAAATGWLAALRDGPIGGAVGLIHQHPERQWKVEELASAVALSRSAFSARFTQLVGEPPMRYLTRWRMHCATRLLKKDSMPTEEIAERLGYESEGAFRKAFKREVRLTPAQYRRRRSASAAG